LKKFQKVLVYTIIIFLFLFLSFRYIKAFRIPEINPWFSSIGFLIKVIFGYYFIFIYSEFYGAGSLSADAGSFMSESKVLNNVFYQSPKDYFQLLFGIGDLSELTAQYLSTTNHWDAGEQAILSDNRNILRIQSVIQFISFGNAFIHMLIMCVFSMIGVKQLYMGIKDRTKLSPTKTFWVLLLIPSVLFWASGILKEPFMFLGFGLFIRSILGNDKGLKKWSFFIIGSILLIAFKPYVIICIIPAILFYYFYKKLPKFKLIGSLMALLILFFLSVFIFKSTSEKALKLMSRKQFDFINIARGGLHVNNDENFYFFRPDQMDEVIYKGDSIRVDKPMDILILKHGSMKDPVPERLNPSRKYYHIYYHNIQSDGYIPVTLINNSPLQLVYNIPESLINVLLRPYFTDPGSWLKYPATIELMLIYVFLFYSFIKRRSLSQDDKSLIYSVIIFIFLLSLTIGWVTPVLGAIARYRIPILIALILIGLILINPSKKISSSSKPQ